MKMVNHNQTSI